MNLHEQPAKPISFSHAMVEAILSGRKNQTRRIIKPQPTDEWMQNTKQFSKNGKMFDHKGRQLFWLSNPNDTKEVRCRYGKPGTLLYVREKWRQYCPVDENGYTDFNSMIIEFAADNPELIYQRDADGFRMFNKDGSEKFIPWRPSIHMPKSAARLWLKVTDIQVERLQDISEEDAIGEGVQGEFDTWQDYGQKDEIRSFVMDSARESFRTLWEKINGPGSWEASPWVWVVSFEKI